MNDSFPKNSWQRRLAAQCTDEEYARFLSALQLSPGNTMNMSYCRFQNTADALTDCAANLRSLGQSANGFNDERERDGRTRIIELAAQILSEVGISDPEDQHAIDAAIQDLNTSDDWSQEDE